MLILWLGIVATSVGGYWVYPYTGALGATAAPQGPKPVFLKKYILLTKNCKQKNIL